MEDIEDEKTSPGEEKDCPYLNEIPVCGLEFHRTSFMQMAQQ